MDGYKENHTGTDDSDEIVKYERGRKVTFWGMIFNILLSAFKIVAGITGSSQALIADGIHSLSDLASDIVVLVGLKVSTKPSDGTHHYGHAKFESLAAIAVGILLLAAAVFIGYEALKGISEHHHVSPGWLPILAAAVSVLIKEALYQWTMHVGSSIGSPALEANAWHHRTDALSSIAVVAGLAVAKVYPSLEILDHIIAVVVAVFVVRVAVLIIYRESGELVDAAPSREVMEELKTCINSVDGVMSMHQCRARKVKGKIFLDVHVQVSGDMTVKKSHDIASKVRDKVKLEIESVTDVLVHIEPYEVNGEIGT